MPFFWKKISKTILFEKVAYYLYESSSKKKPMKELILTRILIRLNFKTFQSKIVVLNLTLFFNTQPLWWIYKISPIKVNSHLVESISKWTSTWISGLPGHTGFWNFWQVCPHEEFQKLVLISFEHLKKISNFPKL